MNFSNQLNKILVYTLIIPKNKKPEYKKKIQNAYNSESYKNTKTELTNLIPEREQINLSAASSLKEGLEETLTVLKLELPDELMDSLRTTNCIESLNSQIARLTGRVTLWQNSRQIHRWVASALLDIEMRLKKSGDIKI
ncbi:MAG: transposase [Bacteroidetes bacterium]|nr:transposase [Bacteroidota bacterium]